MSLKTSVYPVTPCGAVPTRLCLYRSSAQVAFSLERGGVHEASVVSQPTYCSSLVIGAHAPSRALVVRQDHQVLHGPRSLPRNFSTCDFQSTDAMCSSTALVPLQVSDVQLLDFDCKVFLENGHLCDRPVNAGMSSVFASVRICSALFCFFLLRSARKCHTSPCTSSQTFFFMKLLTLSKSSLGRHDIASFMLF